MKNKPLKLFLILIILLSAIGIIIYYFLDKKNNIYTPTVEYEEDVNWDDIDKTYLTFDETNVDVDGEGVVVNDNIVTIKSGGSYYLSGDFNGQIVVDSKSTVYLILDNVSITYDVNAPIYVENATKVIINLADDSVNNLTDSSNYDETDEGIDATIYSKDDLVIMGNGTLNIRANYNHGIKSKDTLQIISGNINITANNDGIIGKDYLAIKGGNITIDSESDGLKSTNDTDSSLGYIVIDGGTFDITSSGDAISAETYLTINNGTFNITTGGGSDNASTKSSWGSWGSNNETSAKGLKAGTSINIVTGTFTIDSSDDGIHTNDTVIINDGTFDITSGDDGIHADTTLEIDSGNINISECYEGIESEEITINGGTINVTSSDDGINAAGGNDSSSFNRPGANNTGSENGKITINGGNIYINATGDGLDSNGSIYMNDGTVIVNGPTANDNGALDYDTTFNITGGILVASGSSGMAQNVSSTSTQYGVSITLTSTISAGTLISISDSSGNEVLTYKASKNYQNITFSLPTLSKGSYTVSTGGQDSKTETNGLYELGSYTGGTNYTTFTISSIATSVGNSSQSQRR